MDQTFDHKDNYALKVCLLCHLVLSFTTNMKSNRRNHLKLDGRFESSVDRMLNRSMHHQKGMFHSFTNFIWLYSLCFIRYRYDGLYRVEKVLELLL